MIKVASLIGLSVLLAGCVVAPAPAPYGTVATPSTDANGTPLGGTCYAGAYVCPMATATPVGSVCSCPGLGAPSFGSVR